MVKPLGLWHYEFVASRSSKEWRVGDQDDDPVRSFDLEEDAAECVRSHNANVRTPSSWRF